MKIWFYPYQLKPLKKLNARTGAKERQGALIRVEFPELPGVFGHADVHPWVSLGDEVLREQLFRLSKGQTTAVTSQSLFLARQEAQAVSNGQSLYPQGVQLKNNFLITDIQEFDRSRLTTVKPSDFDTLKIKVGVDWPQEKELLIEAAVSGFHLRLDFNAAPKFLQVKEWLSSLPEMVLQVLDYVEDPCEFNSENWKKLNQKVPLALDNQLTAYTRTKNSNSPADAFSFLVLKPAKNNIEKSLADWSDQIKGVTITSYMDHPVGVMHSWAQALLAKQKFPERVLQAGCATLGVYEKDEFSEQVLIKNTQLLAPAGAGLGFQTLLESLPWRDLSSLT
jgi:O-succinylbenzoate synthase